jgi:uncharacterized protein YgiM (DUF1202 family)
LPVPIANSTVVGGELPEKVPMPRFQPHRAAYWLAGALVVFVAIAATWPARAEEERPAGQAIVDVALEYVDTYQGECWPWVRRVIEEATGRSLGFDYRQGYFEAGAVEVTFDAAVAGDVIQIANDAASGPGADYPGLHTSIVLTNHGGGVFTVIDSNSKWDGMVRIREDYNPAAMAARYSGLTAHVYRFDGSAAADAGQGERAAAPAPEPGKTARVAADGDCLNLRTQAGIDGAIITCLAHGTRLTVLSEVVNAGGLGWLQVETPDGQTGWVASVYLELAQPVAPATSGGDVAPLMPYRQVIPILSSNP